MKRIGVGLLKAAIALLLLGSSGLAIYVNHLGDSFYPVKEVQKLRGENRRDDALDMARFFILSEGSMESLYSTVIAVFKSDTVSTALGSGNSGAIHIY